MCVCAQNPLRSVSIACLSSLGSERRETGDPETWRGRSGHSRYLCRGTRARAAVCNGTSDHVPQVPCHVPCVTVSADGRGKECPWKSGLGGGDPYEERCTEAETATVAGLPSVYARPLYNPGGDGYYYRHQEPQPHHQVFEQRPPSPEAAIPAPTRERKTCRVRGRRV